MVNACGYNGSRCAARAFARNMPLAMTRRLHKSCLTKPDEDAVTDALLDQAVTTVDRA